jgi:hypothetical protein
VLAGDALVSDRFEPRRTVGGCSLEGGRAIDEVAGVALDDGAVTAAIGRGVLGADADGSGDIARE